MNSTVLNQIKIDGLFEVVFRGESETYDDLFDCKKFQKCEILKLEISLYSAVKNSEKINENPGLLLNYFHDGLISFTPYFVDIIDSQKNVIVSGAMHKNRTIDWGFINDESMKITNFIRSEKIDFLIENIHSNNVRVGTISVTDRGYDNSHEYFHGNISLFVSRSIFISFNWTSRYNHKLEYYEVIVDENLDYYINDLSNLETIQGELPIDYLSFKDAAIYSSVIESCEWRKSVLDKIKPSKIEFLDHEELNSTFTVLRDNGPDLRFSGTEIASIFNDGYHSMEGTLISLYKTINEKYILAIRSAFFEAPYSQSFLYEAEIFDSIDHLFEYFGDNESAIQLYRKASLLSEYEKKLKHEAMAA